MWKIRVSAAHRSAKQKECVLLIESNTTVGDLLGMVMNGLQVRRNHRICMISKKLHNDEIEFDVSKTVADVGIKDLDAITVTIVSEEPSRQSQRLTKSQKDEHVKRMRAYAAAEEELVRGPKKKAATAKKGKMTAGKQGPKKKEATARKGKMAAATAAEQGATMKMTASKQGPKKKEVTARKGKMAAATAAKQGAMMMDMKGGGTKAIDRAFRNFPPP